MFFLLYKTNVRWWYVLFVETLKPFKRLYFKHVNSIQTISYHKNTIKRTKTIFKLPLHFASFTC